MTIFSSKPTLHSSLMTLRTITAADTDTIDRIIREDFSVAELAGSVHYIAILAE